MCIQKRLIEALTFINLLFFIPTISFGFSSPPSITIDGPTTIQTEGNKLFIASKENLNLGYAHSFVKLEWRMNRPGQNNIVEEFNWAAPLDAATFPHSMEYEMAPDYNYRIGYYEVTATLTWDEAPTTGVEVKEISDTFSFTIETDLSGNMIIPNTVNSNSTLNGTFYIDLNGFPIWEETRVNVYWSEDNILDSSDNLAFTRIGSNKITDTAEGNFSATAPTIPSNESFRHYYVIIKVDADDDIPETNETNNTYSQIIKVNNPTGGRIGNTKELNNMDLNSINTDPKIIRIHEMSGETIWTRDSHKDLELRDLPKGKILIVKYDSDCGITSKKIVIQ